MAPEGGAAVSAFLQGLCEDLHAIIGTSKLPLVVNDELGRLLKSFHEVPPTSVEAAEDQPLKSKSLRVWLRELKEAAYDAADLLDHLDLQHPADETVVLMISALQKRVKKLMRKHSKEVLHLQPITRRLKGHYRFGGSMGFMPPPEPRILVEDREKMIQLLTSEESSKMDTSVIAIIGKKGVGKTTLAHIIFDDQRVAGHFQLKKWVRASEIYDTDGTYVLNESGQFETLMNVESAGGRFLLILDDLQTEKLELEMMFSQFQHGAGGSKILVTTENNEEILKKVRILPTSSYYLNAMSLADSWSLFREYACPAADQWADHQHSREFGEVGIELVAKLEGLPLAARMLGCLLHSNVELDDWKMILNSDVWSQKQDGHIVIPASLWLSYQHLPPHIKQCFSYCSIFPRDHKFNKESIVQMWMAQGLIQPHQGMQMEDTGNEYFDYLLQRSFFQRLSSRDKTIVYKPFFRDIPEEYYSMHNLIRDLAVSITPNESLYLSHWGCSMKKKVRHLSFLTKATSAPPTEVKQVRHLSFESDSMTITEILDIGTLKNLRTLLLYRQRSYSFDYGVLFMNLKHIRVLFLSDFELKEFPKSIGNMKQLRCLDVSKTGIVTVRKEVCDLTKLQTLKMSSSNSSPMYLPRGILNLVNLRHLKPIRSDRIYKVGRLTSLRELKNFTVLNKDGHKIEELKDMTQLRGLLRIFQLENVHTEEEAMKSRLNEKKHLQKLGLYWSWNIESSGAVLQGLRPNPNINELTIKDSNGSKIPSWLEDGSLTNLETLEIFGRFDLDWDLSHLGQLKSLKKLKVHSFLKLPHFGHWKEEDDSQRFPCLRILDLACCTSLTESTYLPLILQAMQLASIGWRALPRLQQNRNHTSSPSLITSLHITRCYRLTTLQVGLLEHRYQYQLQALHDLVIENCSELSYLPDHGFSALVSLKTLRIEDCPKLRYKPVENGGCALLPSSLLDFKLIKCAALTNDSFFMGMGKLHSLTSMVIEDNRTWSRIVVDDDHSPKQSILTSLPWELLQHFESIKELEIVCCDRLEILGLQALVSLKRLKISDCTRLVACSSSAGNPPILLEYLEIKNSPLQMLSGELLRSLINLQELKIMKCHVLQSFPNDMNEGLHCLASLKRLYIDRCYGLYSLPNELATIPSLEELIITDCWSIESLPENGLPASLVMLVISDCPYLKKSCTKEGEYWSKISHVFYIEVDGRNVNEEISLESEMSSQLLFSSMA